MQWGHCDRLTQNYVLHVELVTNPKGAGRISSSSHFSEAIPNFRELGLCFPFLFQPAYSFSTHVFLQAAGDGEQLGTSLVTVHGRLLLGACPETSGSLHVAVTPSSQA